MSIALPPEVSERALQAFRDVVGPDHVLTDPDQMREFRDLFWAADWDEYEACAVVQPASVEEIQAIVRLATSAGCHCGPRRRGATTGMAARRLASAGRWS